jgi:hypothetical protein
MAEPEAIRQIAHSRAPLSSWLGIVLLFILFGVIVLAVIGPSPRGSDYEQTRARKRMENLKALREEADKTLTTYAWVDKGKGVARIPIERAMDLTVGELAKQKPAPAGPIATPQAEAGATAPASAGSPAPAGSPKAGAQPSPQSAASPAPQQSPVSHASASPPAHASPSAAASAASTSPTPATSP